MVSFFLLEDTDYPRPIALNNNEAGFSIRKREILLHFPLYNKRIIYPFMRPRGLAYILSCKTKLTHRCVKPDLWSRGDGQSSSRTGAYSPLPACLHLTGFAFPKQKNKRIPGAGRPEQREKK